MCITTLIFEDFFLLLKSNYSTHSFLPSFSFFFIYLSLLHSSFLLYFVETHFYIFPSIFCSDLFLRSFLVQCFPCLLSSPHLFFFSEGSFIPLVNKEPYGVRIHFYITMLQIILAATEVTSATIKQTGSQMLPLSHRDSFPQTTMQTGISVYFHFYWFFERRHFFIFLNMVAIWNSLD